MQPQSPQTDDAVLTEQQVRLIKLGLAALVVLGIAVLAFFIVREVKSEKVSARWDEFAAIKAEFEPTSIAQDPLFEGVGDPYRERRVRYIERLERFLSEGASEADDALAPQVHWLIAKLSADQVITMKDDLDLDRRRAAYDRAIEHVRILRDEYPDFHTNWRMFRPLGEASLTKRFLRTLEANVKWEAEHLPVAREPQTDTVVVLRTTRGDMRLGLYREEAPELVDLFLKRAARGDYDGTAFFAKVDTKAAGVQEEATVRGGHVVTWGAKPFDREQHQTFAKRENPGSLLPAATRWLMPHARGLVVAWHQPGDEYDGSPQFMVVTARSPMLDYRYSPIGKLLDESSLATADRVFAGEAWRDDLTVDIGTDEGREVADFLQTPVTIVKALVFDAGTLRDPGDKVGPNRAELDETERSLETLEADAYRDEPPTRPTAPGEPESPGEPEAPEEPGMPDESEDE